MMLILEPASPRLPEALRLIAALDAYRSDCYRSLARTSSRYVTFTERTCSIW